MDFSYLKGQKTVNKKGECGIITEVVNDTEDNCYLHIDFETRSTKFKFFNKSGYITKFLTFSDSDISNKLQQDIENHKNKTVESNKKTEEKSENAEYFNESAEYSENDIIRFGRKTENYSEFSNFNGPTFYDGRQYKCSEAAWQSLKTMDPEERESFTSLSGSSAKSKGRKVSLRPDWDTVKDQLMEEVCFAKFSQNEDYKDILLSTGDKILIENTTGWHDNYWGDCQCEKCKNNPGLNHLGIALMKVRKRLREGVNENCPQ